MLLGWGHSVALTQVTQLPFPSQTPCAHEVPTGAFVIPHTPAVQVACWQELVGCGQPAAEVQGVPPPPLPPQPFAQICSSRAMRASRSSHEQVEVTRQTPFAHVEPAGQSGSFLHGCAGVTG